jgi:hypothetical protein
MILSPIFLPQSHYLKFVYVIFKLKVNLIKERFARLKSVSVLTFKFVEPDPVHSPGPLSPDCDDTYETVSDVSIHKFIFFNFIVSFSAVQCSSVLCNTVSYKLQNCIVQNNAGKI